MKSENRHFWFVLMLTVVSSPFLNAQSDSESLKFYDIEEQEIPYYQLIGEESKKTKSVYGFEISEQVSYGSYKQFLKEQRKTLSDSLYQTLLPDSSICIPSCYAQYLNSTDYDAEPVVGISWDAAMQYCKWVSFKENDSNWKIAYRLPTLNEWLSTWYFKNEWGVYMSMNQTYADWTYDDLKHKGVCFYLSEKDKKRARTRKYGMGDSFLYSLPKLKNYMDMDYYADQGYKHIAFRMVRLRKSLQEKEFKNVLDQWGVE